MPTKSEIRQIDLLKCILQQATTGAIAGSATEATLQNVLTAVNTLVTEAQNDLDFEVKCVRDTVTGVVYMLRLEKDESTGTVTTDYLDATGAVVVPPVPGNLVICDATATLNLLLTELQGINTDTSAMSIDLAAIEVLLTTIQGYLAGSTRTHNTVVATGAGSVPAGSYRGSVLNEGNQPGTWNGVSLPAGVGVPWGKTGENDTYGAIAYDATGTTFVIEYTT